MWLDTIKDRLRRLRKERAENQDIVAQAINTARGTYASYENGITPPMGVCIKLADYFDVSLDYLLCRSQERNAASGELSVPFSTIAKLAGEAAPTATELTSLLDTAAKYYQRGAPCGDIPLKALCEFINSLRLAMDAAIKNDTKNLIDSANAAVISALQVTNMPAKYLEAMHAGEDTYI